MDMERKDIKTESSEDDEENGTSNVVLEYDLKCGVPTLDELREHLEPGGPEASILDEVEILDVTGQRMIVLATWEEGLFDV